MLSMTYRPLVESVASNPKKLSSRFFSLDSCRAMGSFVSHVTRLEYAVGSHKPVSPTSHARQTTEDKPQAPVTQVPAYKLIGAD